MEENDEVLDRPTNPDMEERSDMILSGDDVTDESGVWKYSLVLSGGGSHAPGDGCDRRDLQSCSLAPSCRNVGAREDDLCMGGLPTLAKEQERSNPRSRDAESRQRELERGGLVFHMLVTSERGVVCGVGSVPNVGGGGGIFFEGPTHWSTTACCCILSKKSMLDGLDNVCTEGKDAGSGTLL